MIIGLLSQAGAKAVLSEEVFVFAVLIMSFNNAILVCLTVFLVIRKISAHLNSLYVSRLHVTQFKNKQTNKNPSLIKFESLSDSRKDFAKRSGIYHCSCWMKQQGKIIQKYAKNLNTNKDF